jgi:hypothetical protein
VFKRVRREVNLKVCAMLVPRCQRR